MPVQDTLLLCGLTANIPVTVYATEHTVRSGLSCCSTNSICHGALFIIFCVGLAPTDLSTTGTRTKTTTRCSLSKPDANQRGRARRKSRRNLSMTPGKYSDSASIWVWLESNITRRTQKYRLTEQKIRTRHSGSVANDCL